MFATAEDDVAPDVSNDAIRLTALVKSDVHALLSTSSLRVDICPPCMAAPNVPTPPSATANRF